METKVDYRDPTPEELESPLFNAVWNAIKGWDISRTSNGLYSGATGTDVCIILDAIARHAPPSAPDMRNDYQIALCHVMDKLDPHTNPHPPDCPGCDWAMRLAKGSAPAMPSCHVCGTIMEGVCPKCRATTAPVSEREAVLEEAAKAVENLTARNPSYNHGVADAFLAIRALKAKEQGNGTI